MMTHPISDLVDAQAATVTQVDPPVPAPRPALFAWLLRPTGPGTIEQYRDHPHAGIWYRYRDEMRKAVMPPLPAPHIASGAAVRAANG